MDANDARPRLRGHPTPALLLALTAIGCGGGRQSNSDAGGGGAPNDARPSDRAMSDGAPTDAGAGADAVDATPKADGASTAAYPCAPPSDPDAPVAKLSATGCMDATNPIAFASALVVPYVVNSPLWSDGADKQRGLRLPPGGKIHVKDCAATPSECLDAADDGKWVFPVGTVMVKSFSFDGKLIETRLFVRHDDDTWIGYSYAWDEAQTDATIVPDQRTEVMFDTGARTVDWHYPSRLDCMTCHTATGGFTLGPSTAQMNKVVGSANQLDTFAAMNLFEAPIPKPVKAALPTPYPSQVGNPPAGASSANLARSYLHANCAFCHRPDDPNYNTIDLRFDTPFAATGLCNVQPMKGDQGVADSLLLAPGHPQDSVLWLRMDATPDNGRMPEVASYVIDQSAVDLVGRWITSITACPTM